MVRKGGGSRNSKRTTLPAVVPSGGTSGSLSGGSTILLPPAALTHAEHGSTDDTKPLTNHQHHKLPNGIIAKKGALVAPLSADNCPQCGVLYNSTGSRKVTESCGHSKCRSCIIMSEEGCIQCDGPTEKTDKEEKSMEASTSSSPPVQDTTVLIKTQQQNGPLVGMVGPPTTRQASRLSATGALEGSQEYANRIATSSPGSVSNDASSGRQTSSVYSDSADSENSLRFAQDSYPGTIDYDAIVELTSPTLDPCYAMGMSEFPVSTDNKSYSSIINEESEFSKSLMNLRKLPVAVNNLRSSSYALGALGSHATRAQLKEMPNLQPVGSNSLPTTTSSSPPTLQSEEGEVTATSRRPTRKDSSYVASSAERTATKRRPTTRDSSYVEPSANATSDKSSKIGGESPDITQGVPRESSRTTSLKCEEPNSSGPVSSSKPTSKLGALLSQTNKPGEIIDHGSSSLTRNTSSPTVHSTTGHQNSESGRNVRNLAVLADKQSGAQVLTPADSPDSIVAKEETEQGDYDQLSREQFQNVQKEEDDDEDEKASKDDEDDDAENDDGPVVKKKKKRSPVVIHDHITVLSGEPPMYQCNVCQKKFKTKAHIKYHEFCQKGDKPFKCKECGQGFIAKSHYEYHLRTHTGERPYVCPKCGKGFNQRGKVTRHMRSHTGEKPFICQECNRGFANAQALRSHTLIHTGERPFACTYCNKRFTGMTNLKKHVITHTGERPFSCNHCGKSFGLKWTLDLHLRTHSSERPYACDQCSRAFSNSKDLRRHLVIHSGERPFRCWICGTSFRRKDNLDRHIKNTHNQPKEVAKKLANEAAAEYLKLNSNNQSLGNIPVSKVNSVVISNIIKNADLLPAGGIVPNNLKSKPSQGPCLPLTSAQALKSPQKGTAGQGKNSNNKSPSTTSSVQASTSTNMGYRRRDRVIITAPLSPPTTRSSRSKETETHRTRSSSSRSNTSTGRQVYPGQSSSATSSKKTAKASSAKSKSPAPTPPSPKKKTKKKKRSKSKKHEVTPPTSATPEQSRTPRNVKATTIPFYEDRKPTLTLVNPPSPKEEQDEIELVITPPPMLLPGSSALDSMSCESTPPIIFHLTTAQNENGEDDGTVECILPHDVDVDEFDEEMILSETGNAGEIHTILDIDQLELEREIDSVQQSSPLTITGELLMSPCPSPSQWTDETETQVTLRLACSTPPMVEIDTKPESLPPPNNEHVNNDIKIVPDSTPPTSPTSPAEILLITDSLEPTTTSDPSLPDQEASTPLTLDSCQNDVPGPLSTDAPKEETTPDKLLSLPESPVHEEDLNCSKSPEVPDTFKPAETGESIDFVGSSPTPAQGTTSCTQSLSDSCEPESTVSANLPSEVECPLETIENVAQGETHDEPFDNHSSTFVICTINDKDIDCNNTTPVNTNASPKHQLKNYTEDLESVSSPEHDMADYTYFEDREEGELIEETDKESLIQTVPLIKEHETVQNSNSIINNSSSVLSADTDLQTTKFVECDNLQKSSTLETTSCLNSINSNDEMSDTTADVTQSSSSVSKKCDSQIATPIPRTPSPPSVSIRQADKEENIDNMDSDSVFEEVRMDNKDSKMTTETESNVESNAEGKAESGKSKNGISSAMPELHAENANDATEVEAAARAKVVYPSMSIVAVAEAELIHHSPDEEELSRCYTRVEGEIASNTCDSPLLISLSSFPKKNTNSSTSSKDSSSTEPDEGVEVDCLPADKVIQENDASSFSENMIINSDGSTSPKEEESVKSGEATYMVTSFETSVDSMSSPANSPVFVTSVSYTKATQELDTLSNVKESVRVSSPDAATPSESSKHDKDETAADVKIRVSTPLKMTDHFEDLEAVSSPEHDLVDDDVDEEREEGELTEEADKEDLDEKAGETDEEDENQDDKISEDKLYSGLYDDLYENTQPEPDVLPLLPTSKLVEEDETKAGSVAKDKEEQLQIYDEDDDDDEDRLCIDETYVATPPTMVSNNDDETEGKQQPLIEALSPVQEANQVDEPTNLSEVAINESTEATAPSPIPDAGSLSPAVPECEPEKRVDVESSTSAESAVASTVESPKVASIDIESQSKLSVELCKHDASTNEISTEIPVSSAGTGEKSPVFEEPEPVIKEGSENPLSVEKSTRETHFVKTPSVETSFDKTAPSETSSEVASAVEKLSEQAPAVKKLSEQAPAVEKLAEQAPAVEKLAEKALAVETLAEQAPAVEKLAEKAPAVEKLPEQAPELEKLSEEPPAVKKLAEKAPEVERKKETCSDEKPSEKTSSAETSEKTLEVEKSFEEEYAIQKSSEKHRSVKHEKSRKRSHGHHFYEKSSKKSFYEKSRIKSRESSRESSREKSRDKFSEKSRESSREKSRERSREKSRESSREKSRERSVNSKHHNHHHEKFSKSHHSKHYEKYRSSKYAEKSRHKKSHRKSPYEKREKSCDRYASLEKSPRKSSDKNRSHEQSHKKSAKVRSYERSSRRSADNSPSFEKSYEKCATFEEYEKSRQKWSSEDSNEICSEKLGSYNEKSVELTRPKSTTTELVIANADVFSVGQSFTPSSTGLPIFPTSSSNKLVGIASRIVLTPSVSSTAPSSIHSPKPTSIPPSKYSSFNSSFDASILSSKCPSIPSIGSSNFPSISSSIPSSNCPSIFSSISSAICSSNLPSISSICSSIPFSNCPPIPSSISSSSPSSNCPPIPSSIGSSSPSSNCPPIPSSISSSSPSSNCPPIPSSTGSSSPSSNCPPIPSSTGSSSPSSNCPPIPSSIGSSSPSSSCLPIFSSIGLSSPSSNCPPIPSSTDSSSSSSNCQPIPSSVCSSNPTLIRPSIPSPTPSSSSSSIPSPMSPSEDEVRSSKLQESLPAEISEFVLTALDIVEATAPKDDDLESISSESLPSPQSDFGHSISMCIKQLECDLEEVDRSSRGRSRGGTKAPPNFRLLQSSGRPHQTYASPHASELMSSMNMCPPPPATEKMDNRTRSAALEPVAPPTALTKLIQRSASMTDRDSSLTNPKTDEHSSSMTKRSRTPSSVTVNISIPPMTKCLNSSRPVTAKPELSKPMTDKMTSSLPSVTKEAKPLSPKMTSQINTSSPVNSDNEPPVAQESTDRTSSSPVVNVDPPCEIKESVDMPPVQKAPDSLSSAKEDSDKSPSTKTIDASSQVEIADIAPLKVNVDPRSQGDIKDFASPVKESVDPPSSSNENVDLPPIRGNVDPCPPPQENHNIPRVEETIKPLSPPKENPDSPLVKENPDLPLVNEKNDQADVSPVKQNADPPPTQAHGDPLSVHDYTATFVAPNEQIDCKPKEPCIASPPIGPCVSPPLMKSSNPASPVKENVNPFTIIWEDKPFAPLRDAVRPSSPIRENVCPLSPINQKVDSSPQFKEDIPPPSPTSKRFSTIIDNVEVSLEIDFSKRDKADTSAVITAELSVSQIDKNAHHRNETKGLDVTPQSKSNTDRHRAASKERCVPTPTKEGIVHSTPSKEYDTSHKMCIHVSPVASKAMAPPSPPKEPEPVDTPLLTTVNPNPVSSPIVANDVSALCLPPSDTPVSSRVNKDTSSISPKKLATPPSPRVCNDHILINFSKVEPFSPPKVSTDISSTVSNKVEMASPPSKYTNMTSMPMPIASKKIENQLVSRVYSSEGSVVALSHLDVPSQSHVYNDLSSVQLTQTNSEARIRSRVTYNSNHVKVRESAISARSKVSDNSSGGKGHFYPSYDAMNDVGVSTATNLDISSSMNESPSKSILVNSIDSYGASNYSLVDSAESRSRLKGGQMYPQLQNSSSELAVLPSINRASTQSLQQLVAPPLPPRQNVSVPIKVSQVPEYISPAPLVSQEQLQFPAGLSPAPMKHSPPPISVVPTMIPITNIPLSGTSLPGLTPGSSTYPQFSSDNSGLSYASQLASVAPSCNECSKSTSSGAAGATGVSSSGASCGCSLSSASSSTSYMSQMPNTGRSEARQEPGRKRKRDASFIETAPTRVQFLLPVSTVSQNVTSQPALTTSAPDLGGTSVSSSVAYDPSMLYLVEPDSQQPLDGSYQLVYAAAAATTEPEEGDEDGPPNKVRLLYAEALGVGNNSQNSNELQFFYASTTPGQHVMQGEYPNSSMQVQLMEPCQVTYTQDLNETASDMLQYRVQPPNSQGAISHPVDQQPHVLNLSSNNPPVYYYNSFYDLDQQQLSAPSSYTSPGQYAICSEQQVSSAPSTTKMLAHPSQQQSTYMGQQYSQMNMPHIQDHQRAQSGPGHHNYQLVESGGQFDRSGVIQHLPSRRLELPLYTARQEDIVCSHVQSNDSAQYGYLMDKAKEIQHAFPPGALQHPNLLPSYGNRVLDRESPVVGEGALVRSDSNLGESNRPLSGLDLLTAASERVKAMQHEDDLTKRAAAAIAAVGELARRRRLEFLRDSQRTPQTGPRFEDQHNMQMAVMPTQEVNIGGQTGSVSNAVIPSGHQYLIHTPHSAPYIYNPGVDGPSAAGSAGPPPDQQAGIRRGPRKYYLSRSARYQD